MSETDLIERADSPLVGALVPSPNHGPRVGHRMPDAVVLHYTGMADGPSAIRWLCDPKSNVSCHYVVEEDGRILQLVAEARRAWHAGKSSWAGETDLNSASVGIEIVNAGHTGGLPPYPEAQIAGVIALVADIVTRNRIDPARVLAHSDIAPGRKEDPGERFPWNRLAEAGLVRWVPPDDGEDGPALGLGDSGPDVLAGQESLAALGFAVPRTGSFDAETVTVVRAFQRHFRPSRITGVLDAGTRRTLDALLRAPTAGTPRSS